MVAHNKTLELLACKLGLKDEEKVLGKAGEYERLLQTKTTPGNNITDTGKVVICLDLAASHFGVDLDTKIAVKYSGLKQSVYTNCKKTLENLLELNSTTLTCTVLCLTLQCSDVQVLADNIIQEYRKQAKMDVDLNMPQYVCMAVYQACRISKVKLPKAKIIEKSRLKPAQWTKLETDWTKFVDENFAVAKTKRVRKKINEENDQQEAMDVDENPKDIQETLEPQIESYENWKKRVLEAAYKELKKQEAATNENDLKELSLSDNKNHLTPRRSPRKTPQKFSPYKSPVKGGVRLLFPVK